MKQFFKGIIITIVMAITIFTLGSTLGAQTTAKYDSSLKPISSKIKQSKLDDEIKMLFMVYLNEKAIESDQIIIELTNIKTKSAHTVTTTNSFCTYLKRNEMFAIKLTHPGYNSKTILVNTKSPNNGDTWEINVSMYLYTDRPDEYVGVLYYNDRTDNFETGPYKSK